MMTLTRPRQVLAEDAVPLARELSRGVPRRHRDDLTSDLLLAVCEAAGKYVGIDGEFKFFATRALLRVLRRGLRRLARRDAREVELTVEPGYVTDHSDDDIDHLLAAVARLPDDLGAVIDGVFWRGETAAEVGARLGVSRQTVQARKGEALARLRKQWEGVAA